MPEQRPNVGPTHWLSWLIGAALVIAVAMLALHFSEARAIASLAERAQPRWLLLALLLQASTYFAQGEIWRCIASAAQLPLSRTLTFKLSLAKLFIDQTLPSAGISGTAAVAKHLEQRGMAKSAVMAGVNLSIASYFTAYILALIFALLLLPWPASSRFIMLGALSFIICCAGLVALLLILPGHMSGSMVRRLARLRAAKSLLDALTEANTALLRKRSLLLSVCAWQLAIILLDAATLWALIMALGTTAAAPAVFASFMIANVFRSIGFLPGGLGTFEAASVLALQSTGVPLPVSLSATLLFRGLSFWLPMIPGAWMSRRLLSHHGAANDLHLGAYWSLDAAELLRTLHSSQGGLTATQATAGLQRYGPNVLKEERPLSRWQVLLRQVTSPLLLLLVFAAVVAAATGEWMNAGIVLTILAASAVIGFRREYRANLAAAALRTRIKTRARVVRDGSEQLLPLEAIVPGDVVLLAAGNIVPADAVVLNATDAYAAESMLTGESFPVAKVAGAVAADTPLPQRSNCLYMGTNIRSGALRCVVVATGQTTQFGAIAQRLTLRAPDTEFERGIRRFGYLLTSSMLIMVLLVFVAHMLGGRPLIDTLLFSMALAVGLSPELLPAILSVNLARGATTMAQRGVLVRRLNAIENLGSMDVLCTDKTGTLTEGVVNVAGAYDPQGAAAPNVMELAAINAALETGLASPLDDAILAARRPELSQVAKLAEIPFDFVRKRISVVVQRATHIELISKGAFTHVLDACSTLADGTTLNEPARARLRRREAQWSEQGIRVLAIATKTMVAREAYGRDAEHDLAFAGFLTFLDRPKEGVAQALTDLGKLGVTVKLITGDSRLVASHVAQLVGMRCERVLSGAQLDELHDEALWREAERTDLFVEVDPNQKERIILSLKKMGHVVGFLGDGVNDAPAMHAADTSLSVQHAVDVAREAADFVLLERDLDVIRQGIEAGRRTFANTLKYVLTTTSANLGNMLSMALASLFLPFLPLLASQILLNNFLSDIPAIGLADDSVDAELVNKPRRWDMRFIGRFMIEFGCLSSLFDFLTFGALLWIFHAGAAEFRTGWFVESLLTELVIALVVRTRRPFYRSRPGTVLLISTLVLMALAVSIPYLPFLDLLGFARLPATLLVTLLAITALYVIAAEMTKRWFYRATL